MADVQTDEQKIATDLREAESIGKSKVVTFVKDVLGFCRGDVINLTHSSFDSELVKKVPSSAYVDGHVVVADLPPIEPVEED